MGGGLVVVWGGARLREEMQVVPEHIDLVIRKSIREAFERE
jgi:hypothetical protein